MQREPLGYSGIEASVVGLGTWAMGGWMWGGSDERQSVRAIHAALDAGINLIDTAPAYGFGLSEEIVGKAIQRRRDEVVLATKCGLIWHSEKGEHFFNSDEKHPNPAATQLRVYRCLRPEIIRYDIEQSLWRLKTDHIDLYQTHWPDSTTEIEDTMSELLDLKQQGKIRAIGACNVSPAQMDRYRNQGTLDVDQEKYSLLDREGAAPNLAYCREHHMALLAYSTLAQGLLTGKIGSERRFGEGDQRNFDQRFSEDNRRRISSMLMECEPIAAQKHITMGQLAIAWALHQDGCTHALVGARDTEQAIENAEAGAVRLEPGELDALNSIINRHLDAIV